MATPTNVYYTRGTAGPVAGGRSLFGGSALAQAAAAAALAVAPALGGSAAGQAGAGGSMSHGVPLSAAAAAAAAAGASLSNGSTTLDQDWTNRSTASGVVQAVTWEDATTFFASPTYVHPDSMAGNVGWAPDDGIRGKGCLNIKIGATDGANSGAWRCKANNAWSTDNQGFGTSDVYIQYRVKFGPNSFVAESPATSGPKVNIFGGYKVSDPGSSRSHVSNEIVVQFYGQYHTSGTPPENTPIAYRDLSTIGGDSAAAFDSGVPSYQNAVDNGSGISDPLLRYCRYDPTKPDSLSDGCVRFKEGVWYTIYQHIKVATPGGTTGNIYELAVAGPDDSSYTQLVSLTGVQMPLNGTDAGDFTNNGQNGIWLLPYKTNRGNNPNGWDSFRRYDELIVSTSPIACPVPRALASSVPTTVGAWGSASNTNLSAVTPSPTPSGATGPQSEVDTWTSFAVDVRDSSIYSAANGGHNDYAGNPVNRIRPTIATPDVSVRLPTTPNAQIADASYYSDGRPCSRHSYYGVTFDYFNNRVMLFGGARWNTGGTQFTVDGYSVSGNAFAAAGTYANLPSSLYGSGVQCIAICEDPSTGNVYLCGNYFFYRFNRPTTGTPAGSFTLLRKKDGSADAFDVYPAAFPMGERTASALDTKRKRILLVGGAYGDAFYFTLSNAQATQITLTGAAASTVAAAIDAGLVYVPSRDAYFMRTEASGGAVIKIDASTFVCTFETTTGGSSIPAGVHGPLRKWLYLPRDKCIAYTPSYTGPTWLYRVEA